MERLSSHVCTFCYRADREVCCYQVFIGDELKAVDGVLVRGLKPSEVAMLIRGPVQSTVELEV